MTCSYSVIMYVVLRIIDLPFKEFGTQPGSEITVTNHLIRTLIYHENFYGFTVLTVSDVDYLVLT